MPASLLAAAALLLCTAPSRAAGGSQPGRRTLPRRRIPVPIIIERGLFNLCQCAWERAWEHVREPQPGSGFPSSYIDPSFDGGLLQLDLCFVAQYAKYAHRGLPSPQMLSNMYAKQRPEGFIPRQISPSGEAVKFGDALNPPLYAWAEWDSYRLTADRARLAQVLPALARFHRWAADNQRGPEGLYHFEDSLGAGMDDQPRGGTAWVDLSCQMALDARCLSLMARELGEEETALAFEAEHADLTQTINRVLWNDDLRWYEDAGGAEFKSIGSFWALLAGVAPQDRAAALIEHLTNPLEFWRPTPVPSVSADSAIYNPPDGGCWRGAVWPPTNYMVVRGLRHIGCPGLAKTVALEYLRSMAVQLRDQGTLFERCSPERDWGGGMPDMVGWAGVGPIAMLIEAVLGLRPDAPTNTLSWEPRLISRHGIRNLAFGDNTVSVMCMARAPNRDYVIRTEADKPFTLRVVTQFDQGTGWRGRRSLGPLQAGVAAIEVLPGEREYRISGEPRPDGTPPAQPRDLTAARTDEGVVLRWQACPDEDLAGYDVYRSEDHGWRKANQSLCIWSSYTDENPPGDRSYAVAAVDTAGNTSAMSPPVRLGPPGGTPSAPASLESG